MASIRVWQVISFVSYARAQQNVAAQIATKAEGIKKPVLEGWPPLKDLPAGTKVVLWPMAREGDRSAHEWAVVD